MLNPSRKEGNVIRGDEARERIGKIGLNFYAVSCEEEIFLSKYDSYLRNYLDRNIYRNSKSIRDVLSIDSYFF